MMLFVLIGIELIDLILVILAESSISIYERCGFAIFPV